MADLDINPARPNVKRVNKPKKSVKTPKPSASPTSGSSDPGSSDPGSAKTQPETKVILEEIPSTVANESIDERLNAAGIDPIPDPSLVISESAAGMLILLLDGVGMLAFGDYARLTPAEKNMIESPLNRIMKRINPAALTMVNQYADPVLLIMGLIAWVGRVSMESKRRAKIAEAPKPAETQPEPLTPVADSGAPGAPDPTMNIPQDLAASFDGGLL